MEKAGFQCRQWPPSQNWWLSTSTVSSEHYSCTDNYFTFLGVCTVGV